ncbi:hypothetical protein ABWW58_10485 [Sporolactobacillus sp. STCC-11]
MEITLCQSIALQDYSVQLSLYKTIESSFFTASRRFCFRQRVPGAL